MSGVDLLILLLDLVITIAIYGAYPYLSAKVREKQVTRKIYKKQIIISCVVCWFLLSIFLFIFSETTAKVTPPIIWGTVFYHWGLKILDRRKKLVDYIPTKEEQKKNAAVTTVETTVKHVAKNVTSIYCIINDHAETSLWKEEHKLFAAALIDASVYLKRGVLSAKDIARVVSLGKNGIITSFPVRRIFDASLFNGTDALVHIIMQLTIVLYNVDSNLDSTFLVESIVSAKDLISHSSDAVIAEGEYGIMYQDLQEYVSSTLVDENFKNIVFSYDLLCKKEENV